jgi:hypothetical protein
MLFGICLKLIFSLLNNDVFWPSNEGSEKGMLPIIIKIKPLSKFPTCVESTKPFLFDCRAVLRGQDFFFKDHLLRTNPNLEFSLFFSGTRKNAKLGTTVQKIPARMCARLVFHTFGLGTGFFFLLV